VNVCIKRINTKYFLLLVKNNKMNKDVLIELALELDLPDLYNFCLASPKLAFVCNSKDFWRKKIWKDYQLRDISENPKESYKMLKRIKENKEHCNSLILNGAVKKNDLVLDTINEYYFSENPKDLITYIFITSKILGKGSGIPGYYENFYDKYRLDKVYTELERSENFTEDEFQIFMYLLDKIKKYGMKFERDYIDAMIRGDIPFDVTWGKLCKYDFY